MMRMTLRELLRQLLLGLLLLLRLLLLLLRQMKAGGGIHIRSITDEAGLSLQPVVDGCLGATRRSHPAVDDGLGERRMRLSVGMGVILWLLLLMWMWWWRLLRVWLRCPGAGTGSGGAVWGIIRVAVVLLLVGVYFVDVERAGKRKKKYDEKYTRHS